MALTETEQSILETLNELANAAKIAKTAKPDFQGIFRRLDDLAGRLPGTADPDLKHYLVRKSYEKARLLLEGRGAENARGSCH